MLDIKEICKKYEIVNYTINSDGSIDVNDSVYLYDFDLNELPLTFNKVTGDFVCSINKLTRLKGSPIWVGGGFYCHTNQLTSLEFSPDYVGRDFFCHDNKLIDNYCDTEIGGHFYTSLKQDGLTIKEDMAINYNEWRKMYKRKQILNKLFK